MIQIRALASSGPLRVPYTGRRSVRVAARAQHDTKFNSSTIFYGGNSYTETEWDNACKSGNFKRPPCAAGEEILPTGEVATIGSLMAFDGAAPELINGRLAMVGFFAALGAEVHSGEGVMMQLNDAPGAILVTYTFITVATFYHLFKEVDPNSCRLGPFTAAAEKLNGRAAMLGLLLLTCSEFFTGGKALL